MSTTDSLLAEPSEQERERAAAHVKAAAVEAANIPDIASDLPKRPIDRVAVIGAGTMGGGIAMALANIGIPVTLIDANAEGLDRGLARVRDNYAGSVSRGRLEQAAMDQRLSLIQGSLDIAAVKDADLVIEAVFEDMALKQDLFRQIDRVAKPGAILATNTSGLDVDEIAAVTQRPRGRDRRAFLQPGACDEAARGRPRDQDRARRHRHADGTRPPHGQDGSPFAHLPWLHRQRAVSQLHARSTLPARGRRAAARGRCRADEVRLRDGHLRRPRHGGQRRRLPDAQGADGDAADRPALERPDHEAGGDGPTRPEVGRRLVPIRARAAARRSATRWSSSSSSRSPGASASRDSRSRTQRSSSDASTG